MTNPIDPTEDNFDEANAQLNDGLKSCRAVVSNYRALLAGDADGEPESSWGSNIDSDRD